MNNLNIQTPEKTVTINLANDDLSITVNPAAQASIPDTVVAGHELKWSHTLLEGETVTFEEAERAVAELGDGWRLPTRQELESLLDLSRHDPAIDTERFPDTKSCFYWTSTPCAWNDAARWVVYFSLGSVYDSLRAYGGGCVRAVRAGQ